MFVCLLCRRLKESEDENRELHAGMAKREESIHQNQVGHDRDTRILVLIVSLISTLHASVHLI